MSSTLLVWLGRGTVAFATVFSAVNTALSPVVVPLLFLAYTGIELGVPVAALTLELAVTVLIPMIVGVAVRTALPRRVEPFEPVLSAGASLAYLALLGSWHPTCVVVLPGVARCSRTGYDGGMVAPTSMRLDEGLKARLEALAEREGASVSAVTQRLLDEGVRMALHPGIVFRSGPAGRRPGLAGGPDVAEVVSFLQRLDAKGQEAIGEAARWLGLPERMVRIAIDYYTEFTAEIDGQIDQREREAEAEREHWERQQQLLA
ncbi:MAG: bile acid:sodium symporter [Actinobacteria bacterium]|nr:bile acid:sodium symporter [Actinomycetota bacterium]